MGFGGDLPAAETRASRRPESKVYPYLLGGLRIERAQSGLVRRHHLHPDGQGLFFTWWWSWDWVRPWRCWRGGYRTRSAPTFCVEALEGRPWPHHGGPEIFNHGPRLPVHQRRTLPACSSEAASQLAWMGKAAAWTTFFVERLWRSLKIRGGLPATLMPASPRRRAGIGAWLRFYNEERQPSRASATARPRQNLPGERPVDIVDDRLCRPGCPFPRFSRASSGKRGNASPSPHIPTGTTANKGFDIDEAKSRLIEIAIAPTWRSEPTSKPTGLHLKDAASGLSHNRGPTSMLNETLTLLSWRVH